MNWNISYPIWLTLFLCATSSSAAEPESAGPFCYCKTTCTYASPEIDFGYGTTCKNTETLSVVVDYLKYLGTAGEDLTLGQLKQSCENEYTGSKIDKYLNNACANRVSTLNNLNVLWMIDLYKIGQTKCQLYWNREEFKEKTGYELKNRPKLGLF